MTVDLLDSPENHHEHPRRYALSLTMEITYGRGFPKWRSKEVEGIYEVNRHFTKLIHQERTSSISSPL